MVYVLKPECGTENPSEILNCAALPWWACGPRGTYLTFIIFLWETNRSVWCSRCLFRNHSDEFSFSSGSLQCHIVERSRSPTLRILSKQHWICFTQGLSAITELAYLPSTRFNGPALRRMLSVAALSSSPLAVCPRAIRISGVGEDILVDEDWGHRRIPFLRIASVLVRVRLMEGRRYIGLFLVHRALSQVWRLLYLVLDSARVSSTVEWRFPRRPERLPCWISSSPGNHPSAQEIIFHCKRFRPVLSVLSPCLPSWSQNFRYR